MRYLTKVMSFIRPGSVSHDPGPLAFRLCSAAFLIAASACSRGDATDLNLPADSAMIAQSVPVDTVITSAMNPVRLALVRDLEIGGASDTASREFIRSVMSIRTMHNGRIVVAGNSRLRVFDSAGKHLWSTSPDDFAPGQAKNAWRASTSGGGGVDIGNWVEWMFDGDARPPGSLVSMSGIAVHNDTIAVLQCCYQIQLFNAIGRSVGMIGLQNRSSSDTLQVSYGTSNWISPATNGWLQLVQLYRRNPAPQGAGSVERSIPNDSQYYGTRRVSLRNGEGGPVLRNWKTVVPTLNISHPGAQRGERFRTLFQQPPVHNLRNGRIYRAHDSTALSVYDEYGRHVQELVIRSERVPITPALINEAAEARRKQYADAFRESDDSVFHWRIEKALPQLVKAEHPRYRVAIGEILVGDDGSLALRRVDLDPHPFADGDSTYFDVLHADGRYRGRVVIPPGVIARHFDGSAFYATERAGELPRPPIRVMVRAAASGERGRVGARGREQELVERMQPQPPMEYSKVVRLRIAG